MLVLSVWETTNSWLFTHLSPCTPVSVKTWPKMGFAQAKKTHYLFLKDQQRQGFSPKNM